jgi:tetratricopeptide (TPR) repeat protein
MDSEKLLTLDQAHDKFAKSLNGKTWDLLGKEDRTREEDELMVLSASASLYHWLQIGTAVHAQRGEWLLAHVYTMLRKNHPALEHALSCEELTIENRSEMKDFDLAYAEEGLARAYALQGDSEKAMQYYRLAEEKGAKIADPEDKEIFDGDFKSEPWFGMV